MRTGSFVIFLLCLMLWGNASVFAQTKSKTLNKKHEIDTPDTTYIIVEEKKATPPPAAYNPQADMKETVIIIKRPDTVQRPIPTYKDTVIILKKGPGKEKMAAMQKAKAAEEFKGNNYCNCIRMDIKAPSDLLFESYINYSFIFKNDCKIDVWISSKHFRFTPLNSFDAPVKVLRKLSFVQRYDHPDFVKVEPGETYTFSYADDAFFEYDLKKGQNYKFVFEHRNFGDKSKMAPDKTYLCGQKRVQVITIK